MRLRLGQVLLQMGLVVGQAGSRAGRKGAWGPGCAEEDWYGSGEVG